MAASVSTPIQTCTICTLHAEAVFRVEGMDCQEEVVILERRLSPLGGIEAVSADLMGQRLHVKYDAARLTVAAIVDAVGQTGMRMWLEHDEPAAAGAGTEWRWRLMVGSAVGIGLGLALTGLGNTSGAAVAFTIAAVVGGVYPARRAVTAVRSGALDINTLMVVAVAGALLLGQWFEAASVVFLFAVAQWLEVRTLERARQAIRALVDLAPREAVVRRAGVEHRIPVEQVHVGDEVLIKPGEKLPLDGVVVAGHSEVNEAPLTGESVPVDRSQGDEVFAGTINGHGALDVRVTRLVRDTRVARILHLVEAAQATRAPVQSFVDRFARIYTPAVLVLALAVGAIPPLVADADPAVWVYRALVLLVIACPCALVISTPVSIVSALSAAARNGVLVKGGAHLERLAAVRVVAFDKTGTLTTGAFRVASVQPVPNVAPEQLLAYAAAVESRAEHPVAAAVTAHARTAQIAIPTVTGFVSLPGLGGEGEVAGAHVLVGNLRLMNERAIPVPPEPGVASPVDAGKALTVFVAVDGVCQGAILLEDRLRSNASEAIGLLREHGVRRVAMLTGDHVGTAARVATELGLDEHHAQLLPEEKHALIGALRSRYGPVLMVGDGINDAPALAAADVGIAMGAAASDAALETADVALMSNELLRLPYAIRLAQATLRNVRMNVAISLALKSAFLVMAVAGMATLWMAVLADTGASVIVVGNALRLLRTR
ncbi:MAG: cadmium-translocating P-type ATPase [Acidobacteria bacterium]|nr:cadmium-translocating P-type ATPase [Acidobacteriota bacterium]